jgi:hypothetical protein
VFTPVPWLVGGARGAGKSRKLALVNRLPVHDVVVIPRRGATSSPRSISITWFKQKDRIHYCEHKRERNMIRKQVDCLRGALRAREQEKFSEIETE